MADYHLITYRCLHFEVVARHFNPTGPGDSSLEGLSSKPTKSQRHSKTTCGLITCEDITKEEWLSRIKEALDHAKRYFSTSVELYWDAAYRYHGSTIYARTMTLNDDSCQLTHRQYGIEKRDWNDDPFFKDWQDALETIYSIENELGGDKVDISEVVTAVNLVRAIVSKVEGELGMVIDGAYSVQSAEDELGDTEDRQKRGGKGFLSSDVVLRTIVFKSWQHRMEGFWEAFHLDH